MKNKTICPIYFDDPNIKVSRFDSEEPIKHQAQFTVPGRPIGKQRPRVTMRGGFARAYTPKQTHEYENLVKTSYRSYNGLNKLEGPISADINIYFEPPKSLSRKKKEHLVNENSWYTSKPDTDNLIKSILDALNGLAYEDDSQVCEIYTQKKYGERSKIDVLLKEL
jgi:Holliday junction resolvase RusA-like endonuclease